MYEPMEASETEGKVRGRKQGDSKVGGKDEQEKGTLRKEQGRKNR